MFGIRNCTMLFLSSRNMFKIEQRCQRNGTINSKRINELANICNINADEASRMIQKNAKLKTCDLRPLKKLVDVMRNLQIDVTIIQKYPKLASAHAGGVKNRYLILSELGIKNVTMDEILRYNEIMETSITSETLKCDPIDSICKFVDGPKNLKKIISNYIKNKSDSVKTLKWLHRVVILEYLVWKLNLSQVEIIKIMDKYPSLVNSSVTNQKEIIDILLTDFKFTILKIKTNGFLLLLPLESVFDLIAENPIIGGIPIKDFAQKYPRILSLDSRNVSQNTENFQRFNISNDQILTCGNVYSLNSDTVCQRLTTIEQNPELLNKKSSHRYLFLVYYFEKVINRLRCFRELNVTNFSLDMIISEWFYKLTLTEHAKKQKLGEISEYLANRFELNAENVSKRFNIQDNVDWIEIDLQNVQNVIEFLSSKFEQTDITKHLVLVLFDVNSVKEIANEIISKGKLDLNNITEKIIARRKKLVKDKLDEDSSLGIKYGKKINTKTKLTVDSYLNPKPKKLLLNKI